MTETTIIILTGLITSGFTVVLTKLFDIIQNERAHSIERKKMFFEKRLLYAEKTIEYLNEKAEVFERIGLVFRRLDFISSKNENLLDTSQLEFLTLLDEILLKDLNEETFIVKIPPASWLYFKIDMKDFQHSKFNISTILIIKNFSLLKEAISKFKPPSKQKLREVESLSSDEKIKFLLELVDPLIKYQANFQFWAKSLFEARDKLQILSMKIESEFDKFR